MGDIALHALFMRAWAVADACVRTGSFRHRCCVGAGQIEAWYCDHECGRLCAFHIWLARHWVHAGKMLFHGLCMAEACCQHLDFFIQATVKSARLTRPLLLTLLLLLQVKKIEGYGSSSGRTSKKIVIADCGQIS